MEFEAFLGRVIDDGIAAARRDYADRHEKLRGAVAGFEACRDKDVIELRRVLRDARDRARTVRGRMALTSAPGEEYWEARCYEAEVEWVCNVVSAALASERLPTIIPPTARGALKAADILGIAQTG